jgi:hypothetical protein
MPYLIPVRLPACTAAATLASLVLFLDRSTCLRLFEPTPLFYACCRIHVACAHVRQFLVLRSAAPHDGFTGLSSRDACSAIAVLRDI